MRERQVHRHEGRDHRGPAWLRLARPQQWPKNLLVLAGPVSAAKVEPGDLGRLGLAFAAMTLVAVAGYIVNDLHDLEADRSHPKRRSRPLASGEIGPRTAIVAAATCAVAAVTCAIALGRVGAVVAIVVYGLLTVSYTMVLKRVAIVEMLVVAGCIVVRTAVGAEASGVTLSQWFILVIGFGALYLVAAKRSIEKRLEKAGSFRRVLDDYPATFLDAVRHLALAAATTMYCLWAFDRSGKAPNPGSIGGSWLGVSWLEMSVIAVVAALLRFELLVTSGRDDEIEELVLHDRQLRTTIVLWTLLYLAGAVQTS